MSEKKTIENITFEGKPISVFIDKEQRAETEEARIEEIRKKSAGIFYQPATSKFGNTSGTRSERRDYIRSSISEEIAVTINFLSRYKGEKEMTEFMQAANLQQGSIEAARVDAKERLVMLRQKRHEIDLEIARYEAVETKIQEVHDILTGKLKPTSDSTATTFSSSKKVKKGEHAKNLKEILSQGPLSRVEVQDKIVALTGVSKSAAYQVTLNALKKGLVVEEAGKLVWIGK